MYRSARAPQLAQLELERNHFLALDDRLSMRARTFLSEMERTTVLGLRRDLLGIDFQATEAPMEALEATLRDARALLLEHVRLVRARMDKAFQHDLPSAAPVRLFPEPAQLQMREVLTVLARSLGEIVSVSEWGERGYYAHVSTSGGSLLMLVNPRVGGVEFSVDLGSHLEMKAAGGRPQLELRLLAPKGTMPFLIRPEVLSDTVLSAVRLRKEAHIGIEAVDSELWLDGDPTFLKALLTLAVAEPLLEAFLSPYDDLCVTGGEGYMSAEWTLSPVSAQLPKIAHMVKLLELLANSFEEELTAVIKLLLELDP
jgi:hypothetical protein